MRRVSLRSSRHFIPSICCMYRLVFFANFVTDLNYVINDSQSQWKKWNSFLVIKLGDPLGLVRLQTKKNRSIFHTFFLISCFQKNQSINSGTQVWKIPHFFFIFLTLPLVKASYSNQSPRPAVWELPSQQALTPVCLFVW